MQHCSGSFRAPAQATSVSARTYCFAVKKGAKSRRRRLLILAAAALLEPVAMKLRGYPIGGNPVKESELTEAETRTASEHKDLRLP
jgi:hypothetical protein